MAAKRSTKRSTKKTAARGAKKKAAPKKVAPKKKVAAKKAAPKKAAPKKAPAAKKKAAPAAKRAAAKPATTNAPGPGARQALKPGADGTFNYPRFVWFDLMVGDVGKAKGFYTDLMGWGTRDAPMPPQGTYTIFSYQGADFGGLATLPDSKAPPYWMPYVQVSNVEQTLRDAQNMGATVLMGPTEIPNVGRFATLQDPTGGVLSIINFNQPTAPPGPGNNLVGAVAFCELLTDDLPAALKFYETLFGWQHVVINVPGFDDYYILLHGPNQIGGMYGRSGTPISANTWLTYFEVDDVDARNGLALTSGSQTLLPPNDAAGIGRFSWVADPQGAMIALFKDAQ
jgi:predicted enzyme related to lactoylglutathione lyase